MRVLAIDPGYERLGIAVLEGDNLVYSDCFKTSPDEQFKERLHTIGKEIQKIIKKHRPGALAIENLFFNTNQKTAMRVAEVRGAIIYQALVDGLEIFEYTPLQVKIATTGYGKSPKDQVIKMVKQLVHTNKEIKYDDEYDAIAVGLTCVASEFKTR